ncbi:MAG: hypothetical protein RSC57_00850 [Bacilli bacterium]
MKNYCLTGENKKNFIKNYCIVNNTIFASLASGETYLVPYTEEREKRVLRKMEEQSEFLDCFMNIKSNELNIERMKAVSVILCGGASSLLLLPNPLLVAASVGISTFMLTNIHMRMKIKREQIKDAKKTRLFVDIKDTLNENIQNQGQIVFEGLSEKSKEVLKHTHQKAPQLDINIIDKMSLEDLRIMLENIHIESDLDKIFSDEDTMKHTLKK